MVEVIAAHDAATAAAAATAASHHPQTATLQILLDARANFIRAQPARSREKAQRTPHAVAEAARPCCLVEKGAAWQWGRTLGQCGELTTSCAGSRPKLCLQQVAARARWLAEGCRVRRLLLLFWRRCCYRRCMLHGVQRRYRFIISAIARSFPGTGRVLECEACVQLEGLDKAVCPTSLKVELH